MEPHDGRVVQAAVLHTHWDITSATTGKASERDGDWFLPLHGCEVTQCLVDHAFSLHLIGPDRAASIRIERSFSLSRPDRGVVVLEPEREREKLGPALGLFGLDAISGTAYADDRLELLFRGETKIEVPPDVEGFEAWELTMSTGLRIVSLPAGGLSVWQENKPSG